MFLTQINSLRGSFLIFIVDLVLDNDFFFWSRDAAVSAGYIHEGSHYNRTLNSVLFTVKFHLNTCYVNFSEISEV